MLAFPQADDLRGKKMNSMMNKSLVAGLALVIVGSANAQMSLSAMSTFGGGDGWLAPAEYSNFGTDLTRGMAYNPVTGNVLIVSRVGAPNVRVLNGITGAEVGTFNMAGVSGGTFAATNIAISADGQIYVANLSTNTSTSPFKVYRWGSEADGLAAITSTTVFSGNPDAAGGALRFGDSFDAIGSGSSVRLAAGAGNTAGGNGYAILDQSGADSFTGQMLTVAGTGPGDFRLGLTFADSNQVFGSQGPGTFAGASRARITTITGGSAALDGNAALSAGSERLFDHLELGGNKFFATLDTVDNRVRVYDMNDPLNPQILFINGALSNITTTTANVANVNGVGSVRWGTFQGVATGGYEGTLYVMNTNNGIQAYNVTVVPEPGTMAALGLGAAAMLRRRKKAAK